MKIFIRIVLILISLFLFYRFVLVKTISEKDVFFPRKTPVKLTSYPFLHEFSIVNETGILLAGFCISPDKPKGVLLYFYGNGETALDSLSRMKWLSDTFNLITYCVDYRGYGFSEGSPEIKGILDDSIKLADTILQKTQLPFYIYGRSIGTAPAVFIGSKKKLHGLILEAPFTNVKDVLKFWNSQLPFPMNLIVSMKPEDSLIIMPQPEKYMKEISCPLLIIHGNRDEVIPFDLGKTMFEICPSEKRTFVEVQGKGHNNLDIDTESLKNFFDEFFRNSY